jgi:quinol monooxygenase YgiN
MSVATVRQLHAHFVALPGSEAAVTALVLDLADAVRAEPGCLQFEPYTRSDDPRSWIVVEAYRDEEAFVTHLSNPHTRSFNSQIEGHVVGGASTLVWLDARERRAI